MLLLHSTIITNSGSKKKCPQENTMDSKLRAVHNIVLLTFNITFWIVESKPALAKKTIQSLRFHKRHSSSSIARPTDPLMFICKQQLYNVCYLHRPRNTAWWQVVQTLSLFIEQPSIALIREIAFRYVSLFPLTWKGIFWIVDEEYNTIYNLQQSSFSYIV